jgi:hypothetical protein
MLVGIVEFIVAQAWLFVLPSQVKSAVIPTCNMTMLLKERR